MSQWRQNPGYWEWNMKRYVDIRISNHNIKIFKTTILVIPKFDVWPYMLAVKVAWKYKLLEQEWRPATWETFTCEVNLSMMLRKKIGYKGK